jgi:Asp/Glu/hydantoin racemase
MSRRVLVLNPNSNDSVTRGIRRSLEPLANELDLQIDCETLAAGPFGIETDDDIATVGPLVVERLDQSTGYDAFVIACYSDPGLTEARQHFSIPVFGIHESAARYCADRGLRFGVLALGEASIERHIDYIEGLGLAHLHAGERAMRISVDQAANDPATLHRITAAGRLLVEEDGAGCVILGCAGLAAWREAAEEALGIQVVDPVMAAVMAAA